jgi:hypothetical protein
MIPTPHQRAGSARHWLAMLLSAAGLLALLPGRAVTQPDTRITVGANGDRISISSSGTTRAQLLELLRTKYRIEVRPFLQPDEPVTIRVEDAPIDSVIALIMPRGSHYAIRVGGERDVVLAVNASETKTGPRVRPLPGTVPKTEGGRVVRPVGPRFKPAPERVVERPSQEGPRRKEIADPNRTVPPGAGPKATRVTPGSPDSTLRITFTIRAPDSVRVTGARLIDGVTPASTLVRGPFVYVVRSATGAVLYFGTTIDPLAEHRYDDSTVSRHAVAAGREGTFGISLPAASVPRLTGARFDFYDASDASLPPSLDREALDRILARSKAAGRVEGRAVIAALRRGTPQ